MAKNRWAVVLDFDGTVTTHDVADAILKEFGGVTDRDIRSSYYPGVITEDWVRERFFRVKRSRSFLKKYVVNTVRARPGFLDLVDFCQSRGVPLEIVSGGVDLYLDTLLNEWKRPHIPRFRATSRVTGRGLSVRYGFLGGRSLEAFKQERVRRHQRRGRRVLFAGDGTSDLPAARSANETYARGALLKYLRREGQAPRVLRSFRAILEGLRIECSRA